MWRIQKLLFASLFLCLSLSACLNRSDNGELSGRLIIWHNYRTEEYALLQETFDRFMETYPKVQIISEFVPNQEYVYNPQTQEGGLLVERAAAGVGPDMLIGLEHYYYRQLIQSNLIEPIDENEFDFSSLDPKALEACRMNGQLWMIPYDGYMTVLFYNSSLTEQPPRTMLELLAETEQDKKLVYPLTFTNALWHTTYTMGTIFDIAGNINSTVEDWEAWFGQLRALSNRANVVMDSDYPTLLNVFAEGKAAYLIGTSYDLPYLKSVMGENVGVAALPVLSKVPSSLMTLETIAFVKHSNASRIGKELLKYMINDAQQYRLAQKDFGRVPMNTKVNLDARILPNLAAIANEGKHAYIFGVSLLSTDTAEAEINLVMRDFLEGLLSTGSAAEKVYTSLQTNFPNGAKVEVATEGGEKE